MDLDLDSEARPRLTYPDPWYEIYCYQREAHLIKLEELIRERERPSIAVLAGPDGIGRSYLMRAVAHRLTRAGSPAVALEIDFRGFEGSLSRYLEYQVERHQPETKEIGQLATDLLDVAATGSGAAVLSLLLQLRGPLRHIVKVLTGDSAGAEGPLRQHREVLQKILLRLSKRRKLLILIRDAISVPVELRQQFVRWMVDIAQRDPTHPDSPDLFVAFAAGLDQEDNAVVPWTKAEVRRLSLGPLTSEELIPLLERRFASSQFPAELSAMLVRATGGFPSRLAVAMQALVHREVIAVEKDHWRFTAETLGDPRVVATLGEDLLDPLFNFLENVPHRDLLRDLLERAALCGETIPLDLVLASFDLPGSTRDAVLDIVDTHLTGANESLHLFDDPEGVDPGFPGHGVYYFVNPVFRHALLLASYPQERERRAFNLIRFLKPRLPVNTRGAARLFLSLVSFVPQESGLRERLLRELAWWSAREEEEALRIYLRAECVAGRLAPDLLWQFARDAGFQPAWRRLVALEAYREMPFSSERLEDVHYLAGLLLHNEGRFSEALPEIQRSLELTRAEGSEPTKLARRLILRGDVYVGLGRYSIALSTFKECVELCEVETEPLMLAQALYGMGRAQHHLAREAEALGSYERALAIAATQEDPEMLRSLWQEIGSSRVDLGRADEALPLLEKALRICRGNREEPSHATAVCLCELGRCHLALAARGETPIAT